MSTYYYHTEHDHCANKCVRLLLLLLLLLLTVPPTYRACDCHLLNLISWLLTIGFFLLVFLLFKRLDLSLSCSQEYSDTANSGLLAYDRVGCGVASVPCITSWPWLVQKMEVTAIVYVLRTL